MTDLNSANETNKFIYNFTFGSLAASFTGMSIDTMKPYGKMLIDGSRHRMLSIHQRAGLVVTKAPDRAEVNFILTCGDVLKMQGRVKHADVGRIGATLFWRIYGEVGSPAQLHLYMYDEFNGDYDIPWCTFITGESVPVLLEDPPTVASELWPSCFMPGGRDNLTLYPPLPLPSGKAIVSVSAEVGFFTRHIKLTIVLQEENLTNADILACGLQWGVGTYGSYPMPITLDKSEGEPPIEYEGSMLPAECNMPYVAPMMSGGFGSTIFMLEDGDCWGCGNNSVHQLGGLPITNYPTARSLPDEGFASAKYVDMGFSHTLILGYDGRTWVCGANDYGQCAVDPDSLVPATNPIAATMLIEEGDLDEKKALHCASGGNFSLVLVEEDEGTVYSFGNNEKQQLGRAIVDPIYDYIPALIEYDGFDDLFDHVAQVAAGPDYSMALKEDGTVWVWGNNASYCLGQGDSGPTEIERPIPALTDVGVVLDNVVKIVAGSQCSLALRSNGTVWASGTSTVSQPDVGTAHYFRMIVDEDDAPLAGICDIAMTNIHAMALCRNGTLYTWGSNIYNQLGYGMGGSNTRPVILNMYTGLPLDSIIAITAGYCHSLVLRLDGSVWSWGWNEYGQCSTGTTGDIVYAPTRLANGFILHQTFPNQYAIFDSDAINEPGQTTFNVWIQRGTAPIIPPTSVATLLKPWSRVTRTMSPLSRARTLLTLYNH